MKTSITLLMAFFLLASNQKAAGQDAIPDASFGIGTGFNNSVYSVVVQPDGKILAGGYFTQYNEQGQKEVARLNADGTLDASFSTGTGFSVNGTGNVFCVALQADGKILAGGNFYQYNGENRNRIVRLNTDGTLDTSFTIGSGFSGDVAAFAIQPDGKILVGGSFLQYNGQDRKLIARLNTDGSLDTSFAGSGYWYYETVSSIVVQPDGKILVAGNFTRFNNEPYNKIIRLNADGSIDTTFNVGSGFTGGANVVYSIAMQPDGKIIAAGNFTKYNGQTRNRIVRLNTDGTLDTTFNIGTGFDGFFVVSTVAVQPDGKILAGGTFAEFNDVSRNNLVRLNADGTLDSAFDIGAGFNNSVQSLALQPDGKIVAGGTFTQYDGQTWNRIIRLQGGSLGTEDFATGMHIYPNPVKDILYFDKKLNSITVTDTAGKVLFSQNNVSQTDVSALPTGLYLVVMEHEDSTTETRKIIKQ